MTISAHDLQREEDAAFLEDWSEWKGICSPQIVHRRFLVSSIGPVPIKYLLKIPGSELTYRDRWHAMMRTGVFGVYVPAAQWRRLRKLLPAIVDFEAAKRARIQTRERIYQETGHWVEDPSPALVARYGAREGSPTAPVDDGRHRSHSHASGGSAPTDFKVADRVLRHGPASKAQRVYIRRMLDKAGRQVEAIPDLTISQASAMIDALKADPKAEMIATP